MSKNLVECLSVIQDPRIDRRLKHELIDILVIAVCGVLANCNQWVEIEDWAEQNIEWFKTFLNLSNGIPSHDTFGRVFSILDPEIFQKAFFEWLSQARVIGTQKMIHIDGKFLNGSRQIKGKHRSSIALVSAWASEAGIFLGQAKSELKKEVGEKRAMEELLNNLYIKGCIVTTDAGGASPRITKKIVSRGGDYLIGLKLNQRALHIFAEKVFAATTRPADFLTDEKNHGRRDLREYWQADLESEEYKQLSGSSRVLLKKWPTLKSFVMTRSTRTQNDKTTTEIRYYFSSLSGNAEQAARAVRSHWSVENNLHWVLDIVFKEDESRVRMKHAAENFGLLRRMTLNILKQFKDPRVAKMSINRKRNHCNWSTAYLAKVLFDAPLI